jgi:hypothetical protein
MATKIAALVCCSAEWRCPDMTIEQRCPEGRINPRFHTALVAIAREASCPRHFAPLRSTRSASEVVPLRNFAYYGRRTPGRIWEKIRKIGMKEESVQRHPAKGGTPVTRVTCARLIQALGELAKTAELRVNCR